IDQPTMGFPENQEKSKRAAAFFLSPDLGLQVLQTSAKKVEKYRQQLKKSGKAEKSIVSASLPAVTIKAERKKEKFITENVLGYVEGTDLKDEVIVITAHYDHIGVQDGKVYNGADDDGSGTVAVLEMAQAFAEAKQAGKGPRRSMLFMPVTGEEKGLLGSEYYTSHPVLPLESTVANLNIDMIGRTDEKYNDDRNYVYIIGSDRLSTDLHNINEEANNTHTQLKLDYTYNDPADPNQFYFRSDHYNFAKNNIPIIFYFNGVHEDYHQHTDEVEKILFDKIEKITHLVFYTAWDIANRNERPVVDKKGE
ncbi:MAG: M28 family peptidase, partial [Sphingobacteriales bacterium]